VLWILDWPTIDLLKLMNKGQESRKKQSAGRNEFSLFKQPRSPNYTMRIMHRGQRRKFSTGESSLVAAKRKAAAIMADVKSRGLEEAIALHSRRSDIRPNDPDIEEFAAIYREAMSRVETPPSKPSVEYYIRSLKIVCKNIGVSRIRQLTRTKIDQFVKNYQESALAEGREPESVKTSINSWLRNAAAMFSRHAMEGYTRLGFPIENPFLGAKLRRVKVKGYSPLSRETLDSIWKDAVLLRDGDPNAPVPEPGKRWGSYDFRKPHPEVYLLLLLELGLGLRRHEADKAQWDWILTDKDGRVFLEIRPTQYFVPKGKDRRVIPMDNALFGAITREREDDAVFIVPGCAPKSYPAGKEPKNLTYRCERHHRALAFWLRSRGVVDLKPCHLLRKEFGSYVASSFGLFHAQKFLGHSSPVVTEAYYAALTNLPELNAARIHG
jgi:integrase